MHTRLVCIEKYFPIKQRKNAPGKKSPRKESHFWEVQKHQDFLNWRLWFMVRQNPLEVQKIFISLTYTKTARMPGSPKKMLRNGFLNILCQMQVFRLIFFLTKAVFWLDNAPSIWIIKDGRDGKAIFVYEWRYFIYKLSLATTSLMKTMMTRTIFP